MRNVFAENFGVYGVRKAQPGLRRLATLSLHSSSRCSGGSAFSIRSRMRLLQIVEQLGKKTPLGPL